MYKQKILNDFYEELFCTDFNDYASATQNAKTDLFCSNHQIDFNEWLDQLVEAFCKDNDEYTVAEVKEAIKQEPKFLEDMQEEFIYLREEALEMFGYDEDDEDEEEDED